MDDLEARWSRCVQLGAHASANMQREARRVHEENGVLRRLLAEAGVGAGTIEERVARELAQGPALKVSDDESFPRENLTYRTPLTLIAECPRAADVYGLCVHAWTDLRARTYGA